MGESVSTVDQSYLDRLARKRMAAGVLFWREGRVLLVRPTYKPYWEIPGGAVEEEESPRTAAYREVSEELGISCALGGVLGVDWVPTRPERREGLIIIFDGGEMTAATASEIRLAADELSECRFVTVEEARELLSPLLARRLTACAAARTDGVTVYLENGTPVI